MEEELEQPSLATDLAVPAQTRLLWKREVSQAGPKLPQLPAPMLGKREPGQHSRTSRRKSRPPPE
jgi:hypothetical protein